MNVDRNQHHAHLRLAEELPECNSRPAMVASRCFQYMRQSICVYLRPSAVQTTYHP
jgi:hypothetical protein